MSDMYFLGKKLRRDRRLPGLPWICLIAALLTVVARPSSAQDGASSDLDAYKFRIAGLYWFANPTGTLYGATQAGAFPIDRTTGFGNYSTFIASADWKYKRKHHLLFSISPNTISTEKVLQQNITFQGNTYLVGADVTTKLRTFSFAPGYEYDIVRRKRGHLGLVAQINLLDIKGSIQGIVGASGPNQGSSQQVSASGSLFAPLPMLGPDAKVFILPRSDRLFLEGYVKGLYFFGYGDFMTANAAAGLKITRAMDFKAGYQLGNRLIVHNDSNRIGTRLVQQGFVAGLQYKW